MVYLRIGRALRRVDPAIGGLYVTHNAIAEMTNGRLFHISLELVEQSAPRMYGVRE